MGKVGESSGSRQRSGQGHNQERLLYFKKLEFLLCEVIGNHWITLNNDMTSFALGKTSKNGVFVWLWMGMVLKK